MNVQMTLTVMPAALSVKKVAEAGSCNFRTVSCIFPTEEITDAKNSKFVPKFPKIGIFSAKLCSFRRKFSDEKIFFSTG